MIIKKYPKISIFIPTFNEEKNIKECLNSIFCQDYPKNKLEVFVIDNESSDRTVQIAQKYPVKILYNRKIKDAQVSKRIAFDKATGELYFHFDADLRMVGKKWLIKMISPLLDDSEITASFSSFKIKGDESPLTRFLTLDWYSKDHFSCQRTPMYKFFTVSITDTIIKKKNSYYLCLFEEGKVPPHGFGILRKKIVERTLKFQGNKLMELDILVHLIRLGYKKFAYVPIGAYHYFVPNLKTLLKKRLRNIKRNYVGQSFKRSYTWFNLKKPLDIIKIIIWIIYATLFIPELIIGIYRSIRYKTWVGMYQPIVAFVETYVVIFGFLYYLTLNFLKNKHDIL